MSYATYVGFFKSLHTYIYTALLLKIFFPHAVMEVFLKNE